MGLTECQKRCREGAVSDKVPQEREEPGITPTNEKVEPLWRKFLEKSVHRARCTGHQRVGRGKVGEKVGKRNRTHFKIN